MYNKDSSLALLILQYSNLGLTLLFLILFAYRFYNLRLYSLTDKFKDYFPKMRFFFCLVYIFSSIALVLYNLLTGSYDQRKWYQYILQGGGGQCINSIIMIIQMAVLRLQLKKQQPYSVFHIYYFIYVMILSIARFFLTTIDVINGYNDLANQVISLFIMIDSIGQLAYWYKKRLPQFINPTHQQIDQSRYHSQFLQRRLQNTKRSMKGDNKQNFPFITPYLSIQNGKIHILLERIVYQQQNYIDRDSFLTESFLEKSILEKQRSFVEKDNSMKSQIISNQTYSLQQIKKLYILCGRLDLKIQLKFDCNITQFLKKLQLFLNQLFGQKRWYQPNILKHFNVEENAINIYKGFYEKMNLANLSLNIDHNTGYSINEDKNAIYISLEIYKYMWVYDHYEYYMRVSIKKAEYISYPIKRYQEIQQLYHSLRKSMKAVGKSEQLSLIVKKHSMLNGDNEQMKGYVSQMELNLRKLVNEQFLLENYVLKQRILQFLGLQKNIKINGNFNKQFYCNLTIKKGKIKKTLIEKEYITLYEFKFYKSHQLLKVLFKRYTQFQNLHHALEKCAKHRNFTLSFNLPEKVAINSQIRHQNLKQYLQKVIQFKDINKLYAANIFFDITFNQNLQISDFQKNDQRDEDQQMYSIGRNTLISVTERSKQEDNINQLIEQKVPVGSKVFNEMMEDLGNEVYDF